METIETHEVARLTVYLLSEDVLRLSELEQHEFVHHAQPLLLQLQRLMQAIAFLAHQTQQVAL